MTWGATLPWSLSKKHSSAHPFSVSADPGSGSAGRGDIMDVMAVSSHSHISNIDYRQFRITNSPHALCNGQHRRLAFTHSIPVSRLCLSSPAKQVLQSSNSHQTLPASPCNCHLFSKQTHEIHSLQSRPWGQVLFHKLCKLMLVYLIFIEALWVKCVICTYSRSEHPGAQEASTFRIVTPEQDALMPAALRPFVSPGIVWISPSSGPAPLQAARQLPLLFWNQ